MACARRRSGESWARSVHTPDFRHASFDIILCLWTYIIHLETLGLSKTLVCKRLETNTRERGPMYMHARMFAQVDRASVEMLSKTWSSMSLPPCKCHLCVEQAQPDEGYMAEDEVDSILERMKRLSSSKRSPLVSAPLSLVPKPSAPEKLAQKRGESADEMLARMLSSVKGKEKEQAGALFIFYF